MTSRASGSATPSGVRCVRPLYASTPRRMFSIDFAPRRGIAASAPSSSARSRSASDAMPEPLEELLRGLHPDALDAEHLHQRRRDTSRAAPRGTGRCRCCAMRRDAARRCSCRRPAARSAAPSSTPAPSGARVLERLGGALVGHELEERLARELHQRANLAQAVARSRGWSAMAMTTRTSFHARVRAVPCCAPSAVASTRRSSTCRSRRCARDTTPTSTSTARARSSRRTVTIRACGCRCFSATRAVLCGIDEAIAILKLCSGRRAPDGRGTTAGRSSTVRALYDGDAIEPFETVMTIEGDYALFAHLETPYLGVLARRTRIATNARAIVDAADGKEVLFFPGALRPPSRADRRRLRGIHLRRARRLDRRERRVVGLARDGHRSARADRRVRRRHRARDAEVRAVHRSRRST